MCLVGTLAPRRVRLVHFASTPASRRDSWRGRRDQGKVRAEHSHLITTARSHHCRIAHYAADECALAVPKNALTSVFSNQSSTEIRQSYLWSTCAGISQTRAGNAQCRIRPLDQGIEPRPQALASKHKRNTRRCERFHYKKSSRDLTLEAVGAHGGSFRQTDGSKKIDVASCAVGLCQSTGIPRRGARRRQRPLQAGRIMVRIRRRTRWGAET